MFWGLHIIDLVTGNCGPTEFWTQAGFGPTAGLCTCLFYDINQVAAPEKGTKSSKINSFFVFKNIKDSCVSACGIKADRFFISLTIFLRYIWLLKLTVFLAGWCSRDCRGQNQIQDCSQWLQSRPACSSRPTWTASPERQDRMSTDSENNKSVKKSRTSV